MKKITFLTLLSCVFILGAFAQCVPQDSTGVAGLSPKWSDPDFDCIVPGDAYGETIFFENFSVISGITINSLRLDSIAPMYDDDDVAIPNTGIPAGLVYTTDLGDVPVTWNSGETGCISISGTADAGITYLGNWRIGIYVTLNTSIGILSDEAGTLAESFNAGDFSFFLKVRDAATPCDSFPVGINELSAISQLSVAPNPFSSTAVITFKSKVTGQFSAIMTDVVGKEVDTRELEISNGYNTFNIERGNLSSGIYFYTITNGEQSITKRLVIRD